jgi:hypothetical protein
MAGVQAAGPAAATSRSKPDSLAKTGKTRDIELTEKELGRAAGGVLIGLIKEPGQGRT